MEINNKFLRTGFILTILSGLCTCQQDESNNIDTPSSAGNTVAHNHGDLEVSNFGENIAIPNVSFTIEADSMDGWNIHIQTENFRFAPEKNNADAAAGEGHAHLYVDGFKMARLYGNWYHLKKLTPGEHKVRISLNANDHSNWSHQGQAIEATQKIIQN